MVTIEQIKQLREETGISISECKKALEQTTGDFEKAKALLREWGKEVANKKQSREAGQGLIESYVHQTGKVGVLIDLRCETDFVAKADDFKALAKELAMQVASMDPESVEELLTQTYIRDSGKTIQDIVQQTIAKLGENIVVKAFSRFQI
jgi:elongation factor Ts